jgi:hypothetical protein
MRGQVNRQESLFEVISLEQRVPQDHPSRPIKRRCDEFLAQMSRQPNTVLEPTAAPVASRCSPFGQPFG